MSNENINVLNYVLLNATTGDRRKAAPPHSPGQCFLEQPLLNSAIILPFFLIKKTERRFF